MQILSHRPRSEESERDRGAPTGLLRGCSGTAAALVLKMPFVVPIFTPYAAAIAYLVDVSNGFTLNMAFIFCQSIVISGQGGMHFAVSPLCKSLFLP